MDNSPPIPPSGTRVPEPHRSPPQGTPPLQVPSRRPTMQQWVDELSSDDDSIEELWAIPADAELHDWMQRLMPLSRFCCEAGALLVECGPEVVLGQARVLLEQGAGLNEVDTVTGRTPLHWACYGGCVELLGFLCEQGTAHMPGLLDSKDNKGATPLYLAIQSPHLKQPAPLVEFLLKQGAQIDQLPNRGTELVHADFLTIEIVKHLEAAGLNIDAGDRFRETPLLRACTGNKLALAQYLLQHGANPNAGGLFQRTILHIGDLKPDAALLLLSNGADVDVSDELGMTPLMYAINCENMALARVLVAHGASLYKKSVDGMSVLDHARQAGESFTFFVVQKMGLLPDTRPASS